jgi:hypothetical protein
MINPTEFLKDSSLAEQDLTIALLFRPPFLSKTPGKQL